MGVLWGIYLGVGDLFRCGELMKLISEAGDLGARNAMY